MGWGWEGEGDGLSWIETVSKGFETDLYEGFKSFWGLTSGSA